MIEVLKTGSSSIHTIRNLANIIWPATYAGILSPQQVDYMMELFYSRHALERQMEKGHQFIIAFGNQEPVAFASYSPKENNPSVYQLHKIYILPNQQGKGIGKLLINFIRADIKPANTLQLNVNRHNKALHFYEKLGFKIIAQEDIDIGSGYYMNDYVLEMKW